MLWEILSHTANWLGAGVVFLMALAIYGGTRGQRTTRRRSHQNHDEGPQDA